MCEKESECVRKKERDMKKGTRKKRKQINKREKNALRIKRAAWKDGHCYRSASAVSEEFRKGKGRPCTQKRFFIRVV